jgi:hypothetical protein
MHTLAMETMLPQFAISGPVGADPGPLVNLLDLWSHPQVMAALGFAFPGIHQITGSCVGAGGGNVLFSLIGVEVIRLNDPEEIAIPFWLFTYGKSREELGERSEGEGSLGSTFALAARKWGVLDQRADGLPQPEKQDGFVWGESVEMKWSNGLAIDQKWIPEGAKNLVKSTAEIKSSAQARDAIRNYYPVTFANNNFCEPNNARVQGSSAPVLVGDLDARGGHQTSLQAVWDHPELGVLFWYQNQWGNAYKGDPATGRKDGCWIKAATVDKAIRSLDAEVYAFSQFDGFPAQSFDIANILPRAE